MWIERVGLEDHGEATLGGGDVVDASPVNLKCPTTHLLKPCDDPQERRFSAPGRANEDDQFAIVYVKVDVMQNIDGAEGFLDVGELDLAHL